MVLAYNYHLEFFPVDGYDLIPGLYIHVKVVFLVILSFRVLLP